MLFNSYAFLTFLPIVWAVYFILNRFRLFKAGSCVLIIASFVFYGYADYRLCFLLAFSITINYLLHLVLTDAGDTDGGQRSVTVRRLSLTAGIVVNLGLLYYFKYLDFTLENMNRFLGTDFVLKNIVLPLGISFYTFQQLSFVIDSYQRKTERSPFLEYCLFVSFFPQLVAGPIVLHEEMIPQFRNPEKRKINYENMISGMEYFIIGFAKKILVADSFARICDAGYENLHQLSSFSAVITILTFTLQIYFDFSGYCDMALGLGRFFNIVIPINFDSPYKAATISDFWKRWHMTLTRFLTTYVYIPLGGSRKGMRRTCINVMLVFTVSGLWHGAAWTYVLWGIIHGVAMVICRVGRKVLEHMPQWLLWISTFVFVNIAWVFFRAEFFRQPWYLLRQVVSGGAGGLHGDMVSAFCDNTIWKLTLERLMAAPALQCLCQIAVTLWCVFGVVICVRFPSSHELIRAKRRSGIWYVWLSILFVWSFTWLSQVSKFIYFNF